MLSIRTVGITMLVWAFMWAPVSANEKTVSAEHSKVIVVGAGIAGMTGALMLAQKGIDVILLEKEDALGGKVYAPVLGGVAANLGAQYYFPGVHPVVDGYLKSFQVQGIEAGGFFWKGRYEQGAGRTETPKGIERDVQRALAQMRRDFKQAARGKAFFFDREPRNKAWDRLEKMDSYTYLSKFPAHVFEFFKGEIGNETGGDLRNLSAIVLVGWNASEEARRFILKGGNQVLMEKMKEDFLKAGGRLHLKATVSRVSQTGASVTAECADGRKFSAEYLIAATPAHVARKIVSGLPAKKAAALEAVRYLPIIELGLHIDNFPKDSILVWDEAINGIVNQTGPAIGQPDRGTVVSITITNPDTQNLGDEALLKQTAAVLKKISPAFDPGKDILAYSVKRWPKGIFRLPAGFASKYQKDLRAPVGRVYFAGDYLSDPSLMGAAWAGARAADGIMKKMPAKSVR